MCNAALGLYYCPGDDTRHPCPTTDMDYTTLVPSGWRALSIAEPAWVRQPATGPNMCNGVFKFDDGHQNEVLIQCPWNGTHYWCDDQLWYRAGPGYYLA